QTTTSEGLLYDNPTITCDFATAATHTLDISVCDSHDGDNTTTPMPCAGNVTTLSIDFSVKPNRAPVALARIDLFSEWAGESNHAALFSNGPSYDPDDDTLTSFDWLCSGGGGAGAGASFLCDWFIPGTPVAALTITDDEGATDVDIHNRVRVTNADPMPLITLTPDGSADLRGIQDHLADLDAAFGAVSTQDPEGQALTYLWDCGNGTFPTGASATCVYTAPGVYSPSLTATDPHGAAGVSVLGTVWVDFNSDPDAIISGPDDGDIATEDNLSWVGDVDHSVLLSAHNSTDHDGQPIVAWLWDCDTGALGSPGTDFLLTDNFDGTASCDYFTTAPYGSGVWTIGLTVFDPAPYSASGSTTVDVRVTDNPAQIVMYQKGFTTPPGGDVAPRLLDIVATADTNLDFSRTVELNDQFMRYEVDCNYTDEPVFGGNGDTFLTPAADFNVDITGADDGLGNFDDILAACAAVLDSSEWPDPESGSVYRGERNMALRACEGSTTLAPGSCSVSAAPDHEFVTVLWRNRVPLAHLGLAAGSTVNGPAPHTATLDASASWDPDNDPILAADLALTEPQWRCDDTGSPPFDNFLSPEAWPYEDWAFTDDWNDTASGEEGLGVTGATAGDASGDTTECTVSLTGFSIRPSLYVRDGNPGDEGWSVEACLESNDYDDDAVFDPFSTIYDDEHCANAGGPDGLGTVGGLGTDTGRDNPPQAIFRLTSGDPTDLFGITPLAVDLTTTVYDPDPADLVDNSRMSSTGYEWDMMYIRSRLWGGNGDAELSRDDFNVNLTNGPTATFSLETAGIWRIGMKASTNGTSLAQILATQTAANNGAFLVTGTGEDLLSQPLCKEENSFFAPGNQAAIFVVSAEDAMLFSIGERVNVFDTDVEDPAGDGDGVPFGDTIFTPIGETDGAINATLCDIVQVGADGHWPTPHAHLYLDGFVQSPESYDFPSAYIQQIAVQKNEPDINYMVFTTDGFLGNLQYQGSVPGSGSGSAVPDYHASHRWAGSTPLGYAPPAQVGSDDRFVSVSTGSAESTGIIQATFDSLPPANPVHRIQYVRSVYTPGAGPGDLGLGWFDFNFEDQLDLGAEDPFGYSDLAGGACNSGETCRNAMSLGNGIRASLEDESHAASGDRIHIAFFNADNTQIRTSSTLGRTFGPTVTVNNIGGSVSSTFPAVSLALDDGPGGPVVMALAWADTRDGTERIYYACTDNLSTIWPPVSYALADLVASPTRQRQPNVVVRGLEIYTFWTDNRRRGGSYEVFFQTDTCVIP
ncbi:PKD domain-containing protein, partial [bacterium]|nr:PKD domain-containing protein [bacterium]